MGKSAIHYINGHFPVRKLLVDQRVTWFKPIGIGKTHQEMVIWPTRTTDVFPRKWWFDRWTWRFHSWHVCKWDKMGMSEKRDSGTKCHLCAPLFFSGSPWFSEPFDLGAWPWSQFSDKALAGGPTCSANGINNLLEIILTTPVMFSFG